MAMRSLGYMPSEVELAIIMQRLDMDGELGVHGVPPEMSQAHWRDLGFERSCTWTPKAWFHVLVYI